jgi:hypothetical protein
MTTRTATKSKAPEVGAKTASTRLLDLLAGWSAYASKDEESNLQDPSLSAEEIGALYQLAGESSESWEEMSIDDQEKAVSAFVAEHVMPLLLRRANGA